MAFVKFTKSGRTGSVRVSLAKNGVLFFNPAAAEVFSLDQYSHCVLYFDKEAQTIALELTNDETIEGAKKLRASTYGRTVAIQGFLSFFSVVIAATYRYAVAIDPKTGWLLLDLRKPL